MGAEVLLASRFPYLTAAQRRDVLASTEIASGGPLDDGSGYARLNLYAAVDGYGAFTGPVTVQMDASRGGYNAVDAWRNDISGPGGLTLSGTGTLILTGNDTYSGGTTVNGGSLVVNGSVSSAVTVNAGGTLRGIGTIGGTTIVNSGGRLAPGNSPGTLTFTAPVTLNAGSTSQFDIDGTGTGNGAGNYSRVVVTGAGNTYTAGGTLLPQLRGITGSATNSFTPTLGQSFQIVSAQGGVLGGYSSITQPAGLPANTRFDPVLGANAVTLYVTPLSYANLAANGISQTEQQSAVGQALDAGRATVGLTTAGAGLYGPLYAQTGSNITATLNQLSPTIYGDALMVQRNGWYQTSRAVGQELESRRGGISGETAQAAGPGQSVVWIRGIGEFLNVNAGSGAPSYSASTGGFAAGIDTAVLPELRVGGAIGYAGYNASSTNATFSGDSVQILAYGSYKIGNGFVDVQGGGLFGEGTIKRTVPTYGVGAQGQPSPSGGGGSIRLGLTFQADAWQIEPSLLLGGVSLSQGSTTETQGGAVNLRLSNGSISSFQSVLGMRGQRRFDLGEGRALVGSGYVGWAHEYADLQGKVTANFALVPQQSFGLTAAPIGRDAAVVGLRGTLELSPRLAVYAGFDGTFTGSSNAETVNAGVRFRF